MNWEENRELGFVRLHIFNSRISNSRKIPGPKKRELGGHTVCRMARDVPLISKNDQNNILVQCKSNHKIDMDFSSLE